MTLEWINHILQFNLNGDGCSRCSFKVPVLKKLKDSFGQITIKVATNLFCTWTVSLTAAVGTFIP